jgi:hypothetical protein
VRGGGEEERRKQRSGSREGVRITEEEAARRATAKKILRLEKMQRPRWIAARSAHPHAGRRLITVVCADPWCLPFSSSKGCWLPPSRRDKVPLLCLTPSPRLGHSPVHSILSLGQPFTSQTVSVDSGVFQCFTFCSDLGNFYYWDRQN